MCFTKYFKNFILCGDADHYCLLCDEIFHTTDSIEKHVRWEKHRKALKDLSKQGMVSKDGIHKIKNYYYCQYCNSLMKNMNSVKEHIITDDHESSKSTLQAETKRNEVTYNFNTVTVNDLKVDINFWHCIQNKHCVLCGVNTENSTHSHIDSQEHIFGLIPLKVKYEGGKCYRMINNNTFQCFTCQMFLPSKDFDAHWLNKEHGGNGNQVNNKETDGEPLEQIKIYDLKQYSEIQSIELDIAKYKDVEDEFYEIDNQRKCITCKSCKIVVKSNLSELSKHRFKHERKDWNKSSFVNKLYAEFYKQYIYIEDKDHGKARSELAKFGKNNFIKLNAGGSKGYCTLCDMYLSSHITVFKQHVCGNIHTRHLELKNQYAPRKHKNGPIKSEILNCYLFNVLPELDMLGVNLTILINKYSFFLLKRIIHGTHFTKTKCFACDEVLVWGTEKNHCLTRVHKDNVLAAKVVDFDINFIREIRPKLYHCGFCNVLLPFWETVEKHINNFNHKMGEHSYAVEVSEFRKQYGHVPYSKGINIRSNMAADDVYSNVLEAAFDKRFFYKYESFIMSFIGKRF